MSELITKQAVLNTLDNADKFLDEERTVEKYKELLTECIKVLPSAENDGDLISRQAVLDGIEELKKSPWATDTRGTGFEYLITESLDTVRDLVVKQIPSVENKGEWMLLEECSNSGYYCSKCHKKVVKEGWSETVKKIKFCPNCGADMRKAEKPETCKGCLEPCVMYEPDMRACKKKVREVSENE